MAPLVWLVTGCSSGFGREFVHEILKSGDKVIATARRPETLEDLKKAGAAVLQLDVTWDQERINETINNAIAIYGQLDVLINNAAYVLGDFRDAFETNVFGPLKVTKAALPHMRARKTGTNVFISSISGWSGMEFNAGYAGTKFALEGMAESLNREVRPLGLRTLIIEPGFFRTDLLSQGNLKTTESSIPDYAEASKAFNRLLAEKNHAQAGDPKKGVAVVVDLVRQEGVAKGKKVPVRMALGQDAYEVIKGKCRKTIELLEDWKDVISGTDLDA
ncbi:NAD(P)-binding protein [Trichoderma reesei RUT C-30]|uniref:NAD(P)-binding protein n=1 Tax=Hypocrea jecorina (strain ATCC 56765 / BCRC 32924 / NRRL 11460 / Rut C-30) TaxID=1344414 RepID=A0A024S697_HYPJR|nr:NAD(P)-binding protein [Trichoderma reesei RUT C-30]